MVTRVRYTGYLGQQRSLNPTLRMRFGSITRSAASKLRQDTHSSSGKTSPQAGMASGWSDGNDTPRFIPMIATLLLGGLVLALGDNKAMKVSERESKQAVADLADLEATCLSAEANIRKCEGLAREMAHKIQDLDSKERARKLYERFRNMRKANMSEKP